MYRSIFISAILLVSLFIMTPIISPQIVLAQDVGEKIEGILPESTVKQSENKKLLPTGNLKTEILPSAIRMLLMLVGTISFAIFVYAGVMLVVAQGNEEEIKKFKEMLVWSVVGLVFITTAYAIVKGIMNLVFE